MADTTQAPDHKKEADDKQAVNDKTPAAPSPAQLEGNSAARPEATANAKPAVGDAKPAQSADDTIKAAGFQLSQESGQTVLTRPASGASDFEGIIAKAADYAKTTGQELVLRFPQEDFAGHAKLDIPIGPNTDREKAEDRYFQAKQEVFNPHPLHGAETAPGSGLYDQPPSDKGTTVAGAQYKDGSGFRVSDPAFNGYAAYGDPENARKISTDASIMALKTFDGNVVEPKYTKDGAIGQLQITDPEGKKYTLTQTGDPTKNEWVDSRTPNEVTHLLVEAKVGGAAGQAKTAEIGVLNLDAVNQSKLYAPEGRTEPTLVMQDYKSLFTPWNEGLPMGSGSVLPFANPDGSHVSIMDPNYDGAATVTGRPNPSRVSQEGNADVLDIKTQDGRVAVLKYDRDNLSLDGKPNVNEVRITEPDGSSYRLQRAGTTDSWRDSRSGEMRHLSVQQFVGTKADSTAEIGIADKDDPAKSEFFAPGGRTKPELVNQPMTEVTDKTLKLDDKASLDDAVRAALAKAKATNEPVSFEYQGLAGTANPNATAGDAKRAYLNEMDLRRDAANKAEEHQASDAGLAERQAKVEGLIKGLPDALKDSTTDPLKAAKLMDWVTNFGTENDDRRVQITADQRKELAKQFEDAGWKAGAREGDPSINSDSHSFAQWAIGQAVSQLKDGQPVSANMVGKNADQFDRIVLNEAAKANDGGIDLHSFAKEMEATRSAEALKSSMPEALNGGDKSVLDWVSNLARVPDEQNLSADDRRMIAASLEGAGYKGSNGQRVRLSGSDPHDYANVAVSRAIDALSQGKLPPSSLTMASDTYSVLKQRADGNRLAQAVGNRSEVGDGAEPPTPIVGNYRPESSVSPEELAKGALDKAQRLGGAIETNFNGVPIIARPGDTPEKTVEALHALQSADTVEKYAQEARQIATDTGKAVNGNLNGVPLEITSKSSNQDVIKQYLEAGSDKSVTDFVAKTAEAGTTEYPRDLAYQLEKVGYTGNKGKPLDPALASDAHAYANWAVGEAIDALKKGDPIPQSLKDVGTKYGEMATANPPQVVATFDYQYAGRRLSEVAELALQKAQKVGGAVEFNFNDNKVVARPGQTGEEIEQNYLDQLQKQHEEYQKTPEGIAAQKQEADAVAALQSKADTLVKELPDVANGDAAGIMKWMTEFTDPGDRVGVKFDRQQVIAGLKQFADKQGYDLDAKHESATNKDEFARNVVTSAIKTLEGSGLWYPGFDAAESGYAKMPDKIVTAAVDSPVRGADPSPITTERTEASARQAALDKMSGDERQATVDKMITDLPATLKQDQASVVDWLGKFAAASAQQDMKYDGSAIANELKSAGYSSALRGIDTNSNLNSMGSFIIANSIDQLESGKPLPANYAELAADYKDEKATSERNAALARDRVAESDRSATTPKDAATDLTIDQAITQAKQSPEFTNPTTRPDFSTLPYDSANPEAVQNMLKLADAEHLTGYGQSSEYAMLNHITMVNKTLQDLADAAKKGGPALTPGVVTRVMNETDALGHSGATFGFMQDMTLATAREDVGRAIFATVQREAPALKDTSYEQYVGGFDKAFGGGVSIDVAKNEAYDTVANRALEQAKETGKRVSFQFNGADVTVAPGSKMEDINEAYTRGYEHVQAQKSLDSQVAGIAEAARVRDAGFGDGHVLHALTKIAETVTADPSLKLDADKLMAELSDAGYRKLSIDTPFTRMTGDERASAQVASALAQLKREGAFSSFDDVPSKEYAKAYIGAMMSQLESSGSIQPGMDKEPLDGYFKLTAAEYAKEREADEKQGYSLRDGRDGRAELRFTDDLKPEEEAAKAIDFAKQHQSDVTISGWESKPVITPDSTVEQVMKDRAELEDQTQTALKPYFEQQERDMAAQKAEARKTVDSLVTDLPAVLAKTGGERDAAAMDWLNKFAGSSELAKLDDATKHSVADQLKAAGYVMPADRNDVTELVKTPAGFAKWWLAQSAESVEKDGMVSEKYQIMTERFANKYVAKADAPADTSAPTVMSRLTEKTAEAEPKADLPNPTDALQMNDSLNAAMKKLAGDNHGAASALGKLQDQLGGDGNAMFARLAQMDSLGITGPKIWQLYKDVAHENPSDMLDLLKANSMGIVSDSALLSAINNRGQGLDIPSIKQQVQEKSAGDNPADGLSDLGVRVADTTAPIGDKVDPQLASEISMAMGSPEALRAIAAKIDDPETRAALERAAEMNLGPEDQQRYRDYVMKGVGGGIAVAMVLGAAYMLYRSTQENDKLKPDLDVHYGN